MHHFARLPMGAGARVYLGITHQSFPRPDLRGRWERKRTRGGGVPAVPPLWPLTAPSNERRHSHRDALAPRLFPFLLPSALRSLLFLPSVNYERYTRERLCLLPRSDSSSAFSLPLVSSVSGSLTSALLHLPPSPAVFSSLTALPCSCTQRTLQETTFLLVSMTSGAAQWLRETHTT